MSDSKPVLVGVFEQGGGKDAPPLVQLLTHAVPREGDYLLHAGREWKIARVTWLPLVLPDTGSGLAVTLTLWDPQAGADPTPAAGEELAEALEKLEAVEQELAGTCTLEQYEAKNLELGLALCDKVKAQKECEGLVAKLEALEADRGGIH